MENLTQVFLGDADAWTAARVWFSNVHGLWGGRAMLLRGDGETSVHIVSPDEHERRYALGLGAEEAQALLSLFVTHDFLSIIIPPRMAALPDETRAEVTLVNGVGRRHTVEGWAHSAPNASLATIVAAVWNITEKAQRLAPIYEGPYQPPWGRVSTLP